MGRKKRRGAAAEDEAVVPATQRDNSPPWPFEGRVTVRDRFVREGDPEFRPLLEGPYGGLVVDPPEAVDEQTHARVRRALGAMEDAGLFQVDVTQPFGLGTKLAPTFVTRCLVGAPGTTYRYLGMRMFAHPMEGPVDLARGVRGVEDPAARERLRQALSDMGRFNGAMVGRARQHLRRLSEERREAGYEDTATGSSRFNVLLINRMAPSGDAGGRALKHEPTFKKDLCSVSWHADSSLEHFSTIGVYHVTEGADGGAEAAAAPQEWRVAVRVAHNAEGPGAGHAAAAADDAAHGDGATPPLELALPSRSCYFMLDSWNHHHQHAVLAGSASSRFSSTHRVLRPGHTFAEVDARCRAVLGDTHRRGLKVWRLEQLTMDELEFEWLRQFFVQGEAHRRALAWWREPVRRLLSHLARLETRTYQVLTTLRLAAEHAAAPPPAGPAAGAPVDRRARKAQDRRRKAAEAVRKLGDRAGAACEMLAERLEERAEKRRLWEERERDKAFERVPEDRRPLPLPLALARPGAQGEEDAAGRFMSPMPADLRAAAKEVRRWGAVLAGGADRSRLPRRSVLDTKPDWADEPRVGLEVQEPFCGMLLAGRKSVETRSYALPAALLGRPVELVRSGEGVAGSSAVPDAVPAGTTGLAVVGRVVFAACERYESEAAWLADAERHRVPADSPYRWSEESPVYAWTVREVAVAPAPLPVPQMRRLHRSLFRLCADAVPEDGQGGAGGRRGRKRGARQEASSAQEASAAPAPSSPSPKKKKKQKNRGGGKHKKRQQGEEKDKGGGGKRKRF